MSNIRHFNFNIDDVTAMVNDGEYTWIAFQGSNNSCTLRKVSSFDLNEVFYELTPPVNKINKLIVTSSDVIGVAESDTYSLIRYDKLNPLNNSQLVTKTVVTESPVDLKINGTNLFALYPGIASAENAKLQRFIVSTLALAETIDLAKSAEEIRNANSMDIDDNGNIWIVTFESPSVLVKVFSSGGGYDFVSYIISA